MARSGLVRFDPDSSCSTPLKGSRRECVRQLAAAAQDFASPRVAVPSWSCILRVYARPCRNVRGRVYSVYTRVSCITAASAVRRTGTRWTAQAGTSSAVPACATLTALSGVARLRRNLNARARRFPRVPSWPVRVRTLVRQLQSCTAWHNTSCAHALRNSSNHSF